MIMNTQQRILVTGITSIHGWPIFNALQASCEVGQLMGIRPRQTKAPLGENVVPMCITDRDQLSQIRDDFQPTCVIHWAGVCDLDLCQERPEWAYDLNVKHRANGMQNSPVRSVNRLKYRHLGKYLAVLFTARRKC